MVLVILRSKGSNGILRPLRKTFKGSGIGGHRVGNKLE